MKSSAGALGPLAACFLATLAIGGSPAYSADACDPFPESFCVFEERVPGISQHLNDKWAIAQGLVKGTGSMSKRPRFCFSPIYQLYAREDRAYSVHFRNENVVLVMLGDKERSVPVSLGKNGDIPFETCIIVHEMLHALTKADEEEKVRAIWPCDDRGISILRR